MRTIAPKPTPTPMPAFSPVDRPLLPAGGLVGREEEVDVTNEGAAVEGMIPFTFNPVIGMAATGEETVTVVVSMVHEFVFGREFESFKYDSYANVTPDATFEMQIFSASCGTSIAE